MPAGAPACPPTDGLLLPSRGSQLMVTVHGRGCTTTLRPGCQPALPQAGDDAQELGITFGPWLLLSGWAMRGTRHLGTRPQCCAQAAPGSCGTALGRRGDVVSLHLGKTGHIGQERTQGSQTLQALSFAFCFCEQSEEKLKRKFAEGKQNIPAAQADED